MWRTENRKEFHWTNRGRFESEYKDQFHIVICTYSYYQTDIWKFRVQWYISTQTYGIHIFSSLKISNKNMHKNILEI